MQHIHCTRNPRPGYARTIHCSSPGRYMMKIHEKVAVVVGGVQGMGAAGVVALLDKGAKVCVGDVLVTKGQEKHMEWSAKYGTDRVAFNKCDVAKPEDIEALFKLAEDTMGPVEIVFNCAGVIHEYNWDLCLDVNLKGNFHLVTTALAHIGKDQGKKGGVIVLMSSVSGLKPEFWAPVYSATKHAIIAYARSWAAPENYRLHGVRFNCLCPAGIKTQFQYSEILDGAREKVLKPHADTSIESSRRIVISGIEPEFVAEGLIRLIEDDSLNGEAMRVTENNGLDFAQYQEVPTQ